MVSIIMPVWNKSDLTHKFLFRHWQLYKDHPDIYLVVIDNGSTDNTKRVLSQWVGIMGIRLRVIALQDNTGFGPGNNRGTAEADGDLLIFISNDVAAKGDYVSIIKQAIYDDVLLGPQLLDYDTGWNKFGNAHIPYMAGWCLACTRKTWDKLGGFDERFVPCDYEDIDLSYTAQQEGIELKQITLPLTHMFGQSASQLSGGRLAATMNNQQLFKDKWQL